MMVAKINVLDFSDELEKEVNEVLFHDKEPSNIAEAFNNGARCVMHMASTLALKIYDRQFMAERRAEE